MRTAVFFLLLGFVPGVGASYKCIDANGATHFGDSPPPACANSVTYEISSSGATMRRIDPQASSNASQAANDKQAAEKVAAAKRQDRVLLDSYTSVQEIDRARDRYLEMLRVRLASADAASRNRLAKDLEETQRRFDADRTRWLELRAGR